MKPQKQKFLHRPEEGVFGDCYRTAIACLLDKDRDEVPHFYDRLHNQAVPDDVTNAIRAWLREHGYGRVVFAFGNSVGLNAVLTMMEALNAGVFWLLSGTSRTGCNHVVVCRGGEIIHDPGLTDPGIIGACDDGYFWAEVIIPESQVAAA